VVIVGTTDQSNKAISVFKNGKKEQH